MIKQLFRRFQTSPAWRETPWTTAGGRTRPIRELDDDHLRNIIFYLHRESGWVFNKMGYSSHDIIWKNEVINERKTVLDLMLREAEYRKLSWR